MNSQFKCSKCSYHKDVVKVDGQAITGHCYFFQSWEGDIGCSQWHPRTKPDTAEENLADNQTNSYLY